MVQYPTIQAMDKALDADPTANHRFLGQRQTLVERKIEDPRARITTSSNPFGPEETVSVTERKTQGLKAPKKSFIELSQYEKRYGKAPADRIKVQYFNGVALTGVDVVNEADIGVYEYVDECATSLDRTTQLSTPDTTLSADQTNVIHEAALKQMAKPATECVTLTSVAESVKDHKNTKAESGETKVDGEEEAEDDDNEDDGPVFTGQPFASLFLRMKGSDKKRTASQAGVEKIKENKLPKKPKGGNAKKRKSGEEPEAPPSPSGFRRPAPIPSNDEDKSLIASYEKQLQGHSELNPPSADDNAFVPWAKTRLADLQGLKSGLQLKKKSLSRRKGDCEELTTSMNHIAGEIDKMVEFLKALMQGTPQGASLLEKLIAYSESDGARPSAGMWKRCLRALAFEDRVLRDEMCVVVFL